MHKWIRAYLRSVPVQNTGGCERIDLPLPERDRSSSDSLRLNRRRSLSVLFDLLGLFVNGIFRSNIVAGFDACTLRSNESLSVRDRERIDIVHLHWCSSRTPGCERVDVLCLHWGLGRSKALLIFRCDVLGVRNACIFWSNEGFAIGYGESIDLLDLCVLHGHLGGRGS
jgi:hypothetical protein